MSDISNEQKEIIDYILNRYPNYGLVVTSTTRKDSKTFHSPLEKKAVDFGFNNPLLSQEIKKERLSIIFKSLYAEKSKDFGLGLGLEKNNLHLHVDKRPEPIAFFELQNKKVISDKKSPKEFLSIFQSLTKKPPSQGNMSLIYLLLIVMIIIYIIKLWKN